MSKEVNKLKQKEVKVMDKKQVLIVSQNAMAHAVQIVKHNTDRGNMRLEDVLKAARMITQEMLKISDDLGK